jgi:hypothetical protein
MKRGESDFEAIANGQIFHIRRQSVTGWNLSPI